MKTYITRNIIFIAISLLFVETSSAQQKKFMYDVMRNGKPIGVITFLEVIKGQKKFLSMTSDVKTTFIFSFIDNTVETAAFEKGIMVNSSFNQKQTGSDDVNKTTIIAGKQYKITDNGESKLIAMAPIRYNTLLLYTQMPRNINKVYSANFQKLLDIKKLAENKYRLTLPDGKFNDYTYKNGICTKVEIARSMFSVEFVLRQK